MHSNFHTFGLTAHFWKWQFCQLRSVYSVLPSTEEKEETGFLLLIKKILFRLFPNHNGVRDKMYTWLTHKGKLPILESLRENHQEYPWSSLPPNPFSLFRANFLSKTKEHSIPKLSLALYQPSLFAYSVHPMTLLFRDTGLGLWLTIAAGCSYTAPMWQAPLFQTLPYFLWETNPLLNGQFLNEYRISGSGFWGNHNVSSISFSKVWGGISRGKNENMGLQ